MKQKDTQYAFPIGTFNNPSKTHVCKGKISQINKKDRLKKLE